MPKMFNLTPQMQDYFDSLPKMIQESIILSGVQVNSIEDLKALAEGAANCEE